MGAEPIVPETRVLAIASHVVSGYVGNKIAVFVLQSLGCDVAALNTVQFSNHTGYGQWTGSRTTSEEITQLWQGLRQSYLDDFDMMLTGYIPGREAVEAVGRIAEELQNRLRDGQRPPGSFFWVLDPVMGDQGKLYVAPDVVPAYRALVPQADLILPNQFEAELLSEVKITDMASLAKAVAVLHERYGVPHIIITSVDLDRNDGGDATPSLSVVGSTMTSDRKARPFKIVFPRINCYFSGTGDMFAALTVVRMREVIDATEGGRLRTSPSWLSPDDVEAVDLPLARAAEKVLASMHEVLTRTRENMIRAVEGTTAVDGETAPPSTGVDAEKRKHLLKSKAAELRLVRHLNSLREPEVEFRAQPL